MTKYYYYTYTVYRDDSEVKGIGALSAEDTFPLIDVLDFIASRYNEEIANIRISFWGEISESDCERWNEITEQNRKKNEEIQSNSRCLGTADDKR